MRQFSASLAIAGMVLMGAAPAIAEEVPVDPAAAAAQTTAEVPAAPPAEAPPAEIPAAEQTPAAEPAPAEAAAPAPEEAPAPAAAPESAPAVQQSMVAAVEEAPAPPYLRWRVADEADALVGDTSITVQGPRNDAVADDGQDSQWQGALTATVKDNTGQADYVGADLDPAPGTFLVKQLVDDTDAAVTHDVATDEHFRVRPVLASDAFVTGEGASWQTLASLASENDPLGNIALTSATAPETPAERPAAEPNAGSELIGPLALIQADCVGDAPCAGITLTNVVVNGSATAADWALKATRDNGDEYAFTSGQTRSVPRYQGNSNSNRTIYTLSSTAPAAIESLYSTTLTCAPAGSPSGSNNTTDITISNQTVRFGRGSNGTPQTRFANCTYTHTLVTPAVIVVKTGGDRTGTTGVTNLPGVVLYLNTGVSSPSGTRPDGVAGDGAGWARCVSDANGECTFSVPNTGSGGANRDARYWVVQPLTGVPTTSPATWYTNPSLRTGASDGSGTSTAYTFQTGTQLRSGQTYSSTSNFMYSTGSSANASGGIWQQSRINPTFPQSCGLDIALVLDLSGSVGSAVGALKTASDTFTNAMVGTPSRMALFSFSYNTPADGASQNYPTLTSVATQAQADAFKARYASWTTGGGTNWDRGLGATSAANTAANKYDIVVVITDGNPTNFGPGPSGSGNNNRFVETENGIFSSNALKAAGTRVLALGVGDGATGATNALNLRAISGPTPYNGSNGAVADYLQTSNYESLGQVLRNLALGNCAGQLTVTKMVVPNTAPDGSITGAAPGVAGWTFTASDPGAGLTLPVPPVRTTVDDNTGTVAFPLVFTGGTTSAGVTVTETQQPGYTLVPVGGQNAVCKNLTTNTNVTPSGNPTNGVRVTVPSTDTVNCIVYNRAPSLAATVSVDKKWVVSDGSGNSKTYSIPGDEGILPDGLTAQLTLTGPGAAGATNQAWGAVRANYVANESVTMNETASIDAQKLPGCTMTSQKVTQKNGTTISENVPYTLNLPQGPNTFEMTNSVTCATTLTLNKKLSGTDVATTNAVPADWQLTAAAAGQTTITGPGTATGNVVAGTSYSLSEDFVADPHTDAELYVPSPAGWVCTLEGGGSVPGATPSAVAVPLGNHATCEVTNVTAELTLLKFVEGGGSARANTWNLHATSQNRDLPDAEVPGSWPGGPEGPGQADSANTVIVQPGSSYALTESLADPGTPLAYLLDGIEKWNGTSWEAVADSTAISVAQGEHGIYRLVNRAAPAIEVPLTGGMSSDMFTLWGTGIGLLAALMGVVYWRRFRLPSEVTEL